MPVLGHFVVSGLKSKNESLFNTAQQAQHQLQPLPSCEQQCHNAIMLFNAHYSLSRLMMPSQAQKDQRWLQKPGEALP